MFNSVFVALSGYCSVPHCLGNTLIMHTFGCHKSGKMLVHFRYALYKGEVAVVYKGRKTDFNRTLESIRGYGVSTFDVSSSKCPILRKVLSDSIFITNIWVRIWYSRDKTVPLYRIRVFTARDVRQRAFLILFSCGFVPFLSRQRFVSRNKILQNTKHQQLAKGKNGENTLTTSNHQNGPCVPVKVASVRNSLV